MTVCYRRDCSNSDSGQLRRLEKSFEEFVCGHFRVRTVWIVTCVTTLTALLVTEALRGKCVVLVFVLVGARDVTCCR